MFRGVFQMGGTDVRRKYQVHDWFQMAVNTSFLSVTLMIIISFHYVSDLKFLKRFNREYALTFKSALKLDTKIYGNCK